MSALLELDGVTKTFSTGGLFDRTKVHAVKGVSFALDDAIPEVFTIVGESGSGKTTIARMVLGNETPTTGSIRFLGEDLTRIRSRAARLRFMARVQPIFQNPFEAFNPLKRVDGYLIATARHFAGARRGAPAQAAADAALRKVGLSFEEVTRRFPHELSGGQLQRVAIARALIPQPALLVADEPVSMVDASLRMSIVNLFKTLRDELGVSIIYITHDLATAYYISDRIIVMERGAVVEGGDARSVLDDPQHPYTRRLKASVLSAEPPGSAGARLAGPSLESQAPEARPTPSRGTT